MSVFKYIEIVSDDDWRATKNQIKFVADIGWRAIAQAMAEGARGVYDINIDMAPNFDEQDSKAVTVNVYYREKK